MTEQALIEEAKKAQRGAYAPYSHYPVGAALLTANGKIYTGCNIENAAYPATVCAERVALWKAVSAGERVFTALALVGGLQPEERACTPCGICRQVFSEFCNANFKFIFLEQGNRCHVYTLGDLLPLAFTTEHLGE